MSESELAGVRDLMKKLNRLGSELEAKTMKAVVGQAMTPARRQAKLTVPVGTKIHKTYKGRWVPPGFAKASIRVKTRIEEGMAIAVMGVKKEAYYAVQFLERGIGPVTERTYFSPKRTTQLKKPYSIKGRGWLEASLVDNYSTVLTRLRDRLRARVKKATQ